MIDLYLKAATEANLRTALPQFHLNGLSASNVWIKATHDYSLDLIGPVITTPATYDENGNELTAAVWDNNFHANLRCTQEVADTIPSSVIIDPAPSTPNRVWA